MISIPKHLKSWKKILGTLTALILVLILLISSIPAAKALEAPVLFGDAGISSDTNNPADVAGSRYVDVNLGVLLGSKGNAAAMNQLPQVSLNLFPDVNYTGVIQQVQTDGDTTSWTGTLQGVADGYFSMVAVDGTFAAQVASTEGIYEVSTAGSHYKVIKIDQSKFIDEPPSIKMPSSGKVMSAAALGPNADSAATIDVMVIYTASARAAEGGTSAMKARIALAVAETNTAYAHSGIKPRLRLVHVQEISYAETKNLSTDLKRFAKGTAPFTKVPGLRNKYGADVVSLIVNNGGGYCGLADAVLATAATAYDVVARKCMTGYYSFGHELGHLQGARADMYVDSKLTPFAYGHGFIDTDARWRTIMADNDLCLNKGFNCKRLQYFSNDKKMYGGAAMGNGFRARNYTVLNSTALTVANFRKQVIGNNFNSSFNGNTLGWARVTGAWSRTSSGYFASGGLDKQVSSIQHTGTYGDFTYQARLKRTGICIGCDSGLYIRGNPGSLTTAKDWKPSYWFGYKNDGTFGVEYVNSVGKSTPLKSWTASSAIVKNGWNILKVVAVGSSFKFYINNILVWSGSNSNLIVGHVGIYLWHLASPGMLYVDWATLTNTPTAKITPNDAVVPNLAPPGGIDGHSELPSQ